MENNRVMLCKSCSFNYPDCPVEIESVKFGDGIGCDNICCCNRYDPILEKDFERGGYK